MTSVTLPRVMSCEQVLHGYVFALVAAGCRRHRRRGAAAQRPAHEPGRQDARRGDEPVRPRHVALRDPARPDVHDRVRDLLRSGDHPAGQPAVAQLRLRKALGRDEARQHHPDVHAVGALLQVQRVAPPDERELARRVGAGVPARHTTGRAGHVHDRARRGAAQQREEGLRDPHGRVEVQLHVPPHVLPTDVAEPPAPRRAGIVHEQVQPAVLALDRPRDACRRVVLEEVRGDHGRATELVGECAQPVLAAGDEHQPRAGLTGEATRGGGADAARCSGDERDHFSRAAGPAPDRST